MRESKRNLKNKEISHKLGIIVPYRDREQQLKRFLTHMKDYLKGIEYEIFIIEQSEEKPFNRGKLLNVGYKYAVDKGCDYFVFHDVDMLPEDVDYSYSEKPLHLATHLQEHDYETTFFDYFGGVTMFTKEDFKTINGFSNEYWGWGFEDDDLLVRCIESDLELDMEISGGGEIIEYESFKFNGNDSYIHLSGQSTQLTSDEFSISIFVKPSDIILSENKNYDEFPIISIPGHNIGLFYNSFRRFFCQVYDINKKPYSITTDILGERWVHLVMVYSDNNEISLYANGECIETIKMGDSILELSTDNIYVGTTNISKDTSDYFKGLISSIEIYDIALTSDEVIEIYNNPKKPKTRNFGKFKSSEFLFTQILPELSYEERGVDICSNYDVNFNNIYLYKDNQSFKTFLPKPYRRNSRFLSLKHKSNSSIGNKWIHNETRKNQIRFYNEVRQDIINFRIEGLNTLRFEELDTIEDGLITKVLVKI